MNCGGDLKRETKSVFFECPLLPLIDSWKKKHKCCKSFKDGKRCKKCPGRK
jgi:hypothetical protein